MKKILIIMLLVACMAGAAEAALSFGQTFYDKNVRTAFSRNSNDPLRQFIGEVEGMLDGTGSTRTTNILFALATQDPTSTEGRFYYSTTLSAFRGFNGTAWETFQAGGNFASLDEAYDGGAAISVDDGAVTMTGTDAAGNTVLAIVQSDTGTAVGVTLTNAGTGNTIDIQNAQAGTDIEGTDDTWNVATTGVGTFLSFVLENGGIINNTTDNEIEFTENSEQFSFAFSGNTLTYATDTGIDAIDFGVVDSLLGINAIAFDVAVANTITQAGTGSGDDLTIQQTGAVDASLILQSTGTSTSDALSLISSVGSTKINSADNLDIDAADDITVDTAGGSITTTLIGGDFALDATNASIVLDAGEAVTDAINLDAAAGGFDLDVALSISLKSTENTADSIELVSTAGGIDITAAGAASEDIDIVNTAGSVNITAGENNALAMVLKVDAGSSEALSLLAIKGTGASATTESDASIQLESTVGGIGLLSLLNGDNAIRIEANGGANENIFVQSVQGTGTDSITLTSTLGGIAITANAAAKDVVVKSILGSISMEAEEDAANAILITADGGTTSSIKVHNDTGDAVNSILLLSDAGGVTITAAKPVAITNAFEVSVVYLAANDATLTILANDSGQMHIFPDIDADTVVALPTAVDGLRYHFIYAGGAADAHDWSIETGNNTNFYLGGVVQHDTDNAGDDTAVYFSDESNDSKIAILTPSAGTTVDVWCDGTNWWITGNIVSATDTAVVFGQI